METQYFGFTFYSTCLSLCKVTQDSYDFSEKKINDCSVEYKAGRYHLRIEKWKRLQCSVPFGRKELSNTFRYVFSYVVRLVNLPGKRNKTSFLLLQTNMTAEDTQAEGKGSLVIELAHVTD